MNTLFRPLTAALGLLVAPPRCAACDRAVPIATAFCTPCAATLVRVPDGDPDRMAAFVYGGAIATALKRFKFDDRPDLARPLLAALARPLLAYRWAGSGMVVPVPLHPSRVVERGYNQAALLGAPVAEWLGAGFAPLALRRVVRTARQTELAREERLANVAAAFEPSGLVRLHGRRVLLVDDVETTGATLAACRQAVVTAGASHVATIVVARAHHGATGS